LQRVAAKRDHHGFLILCTPGSIWAFYCSGGDGCPLFLPLVGGLVFAECFEIRIGCPPVLARSTAAKTLVKVPESQRIPIRIAQHLAPADMIRPPDDPVILHPFDQSCGGIVADPELPLQP
jgi:hypothetical protein